MPDLDLKPETAEADVCRSCQARVWRVAASGGRELALDVAPDPEGTVEMVRTNGVWLAQELRQVECLFEVGPRTRWRSHGPHCSGAPRRMPAGRVR